MLLHSLRLLRREIRARYLAVCAKQRGYEVCVKQFIGHEEDWSIEWVGKRRVARRFGVRAWRIANKRDPFCHSDVDNAYDVMKHDLERALEQEPEYRNPGWEPKRVIDPGPHLPGHPVDEMYFALTLFEQEMLIMREGATDQSGPPRVRPSDCSERDEH